MNKSNIKGQKETQEKKKKEKENGMFIVKEKKS